MSIRNGFRRAIKRDVARAKNRVILDVGNVIFRRNFLGRLKWLFLGK
jgi:hypothetical protein